MGNSRGVDQLYKKFSSGYTDGESTSLVIIGDTIYNKWSLTPVVKRLAEKEYIINSHVIPDGTSASVLVFHMRYNSKGITVWDLPECSLSRFTIHIRNVLSYNLKKALKARVSTCFNKYVDNIHDQIIEWEKVKKRFSIKNEETEELIRSINSNGKLNGKKLQFTLDDSLIKRK
jgi:hypothetical protein